jgi:hypothetical protein
MSKRLQVLFEEEELAEIQALAKSRQQTTAAWVREAIRQAREASQYGKPESKLRAIRDAVAHSYPVADIDELLAQIESGYVEGDHTDSSPE